MTFAETLADRARAVVLPWFGAALPHERKGDDSPVTRADREAEQAMRELIGSRWPAHGVHGEEFGVEGEGRRHVWVLDPIDGTKSFITGRPLFGTLIGLLEEGTPLLGVADMPVLGRRWTAVRGAPTVCDGVAVATSACTRLADARLATTSIEMFGGSALERFVRLRERVWFTTYGGDLYLYLMVASGNLEAVVEADLAPYDVLALVPIVEGAGGIITGWDGEPVTLKTDGRVVAAANPAIHEQVLETLR